MHGKSTITTIVLLFATCHVAMADCTLPHQIVNGGVVDADPVMENFAALNTCFENMAPAGSQNAVQTKAPGGGFAAIGPLTDGQVIVGSAGHAPQATTLTAGSGITITNAGGSVTISAAGTPGGGGADWLNGSAVVTPSAAGFTLQTSTSAPTGASLSTASRGMVLSATTAANNTAMVAETDVPSGHWQATMLGVYTGGLSNWTMPAISVRDTTNSQSVQFGISARWNAYRFDYFVRGGGIGLDYRIDDIELLDQGLPQPAEPIWQRLTYDGTNFIWSFSRDGQFFIPAYSVSATAQLANLDKIGPAIIFAEGVAQSWSASFLVLSWNVTGI